MMMQRILLFRHQPPKQQLYHSFFHDGSSIPINTRRCIHMNYKVMFNSKPLPQQQPLLWFKSVSSVTSNVSSSSCALLLPRRHDIQHVTPPTGWQSYSTKIMTSNNNNTMRLFHGNNHHNNKVGSSIPRQLVQPSLPSILLLPQIQPISKRSFFSATCIQLPILQDHRQQQQQQIRTFANHRHQRVLKYTKGYRGRSKNCFSIAIRRLQKAWQYAYRDRKTKKRIWRTLWIQRIQAGVRQYSIRYSRFIRSLQYSHVSLNRKVLSELAATEPFTFKAIIDVTRFQQQQYDEQQLRLNDTIGGGAGHIIAEGDDANEEIIVPSEKAA